MTGLNRLDGDWLTQLQLGEDPRFFTEWFQPLSLTNDVFLAPSLRHEIASFNLVEDDSTIVRYRVRESVAAIAIGATHQYQSVVSSSAVLAVAKS